MIAKSLDAYVLAKLLIENAARPRPYAVVAKELGMSASELHAAVRRLSSAGLVDLARRRVHPRPATDFFLSGLRYMFPAPPGRLRQGMPTSYAAPPLAGLLASDGKPPPVWPDARGALRGYEIEPLHPSAPIAARSDLRFYEVLALLDALREGRPRERHLAEGELKKRIR